MSLSTVKCGWWNFRMMTLIFGPTGFGTCVEKVKHGGRENGWISKPERTVNLKKERVFWLPTVWEWGNSLATTSGKDVELHHILSFSSVRSHSWRQSYYQHIFQDCQPDLWLLSVSKWDKRLFKTCKTFKCRTHNLHKANFSSFMIQDCCSSYMWLQYAVMQRDKSILFHPRWERNVLLIA